MTISSTTSRNQYTASSGQTNFTYTFKIFDDNDITVLLNDITLIKTTHYTVSGVGDANGGTITLTSGAVAGDIITITRNEPLTQEVDFVEGDDLPSTSLEEGLDRSAIRDQDLQEQINRSLRLKESTNYTSITIEEPTNNSIPTYSVNGQALSIINSIDSVGSNIMPTGGNTANEIANLISQRALTPYDFGAVGDGVTDDTTAMKAFFSSTEKNLLMATGRFRIIDSLQDGTEVLLSSVADRKIWGPGVITATSTVLLAVKVTGARTNIQINIDGNTNIANGLEVDGADDFNIHHCVIHDLFRATGASVGIVLDLDDGNFGGNVIDNLIFNVDCAGGFARGIGASANQNITKPTLIAHNNIVSITGQEGDSITFANSSGGTYLDWNIEVSNNVITTYTRRAIKSQANGYRILNNKITNTYTNPLDVPNINAAIDATLGSDYTVQGNELIDNLFAAQIKLDADTDVVNNVVIKDNIIRGIGTETTTTIMFLDLNGSNLDVSGNVIFCPDFANDVIVVSRTDNGSVLNNTIIVDEASGAVPFQKSSSTNIVAFNFWGANKKFISDTITIDDENESVGIAYGDVAPTAALDINISNDANNAMQLYNEDTTLSSGQLVHALNFKQNDSSFPATVHAGIRTYAVGSSGLLEMRFYVRANEHRFTIDTAGNFLPAADNTQDLGSASLQYNDLYFNNRILKGGTQILTSQQAAVADATGGATVDTEARTAINSLLARLRTHGLIAT